MMAPTPGPIPGMLGQVVAEPQVGIQESQGFGMIPRKSMTVSTKGLLNMPGQNNCFLNSAVQVLWHLDTFRRNFRELTGHACMAESCIFCALKELFTQFQYSQESALPPDALRHALAKTFCDQRRFQLGFMDDAAECFENILLRIHVHIANQESEDMCSNANCIPHQKFAMTLVEQRICHNCGARSDPMPFTQMVHYVTTSALCAKAMERQENESNSRMPVPFGEILRLAGDMGEIRDCPSNCGSQVQVKKTLMNHPEVVSIGLVWDSESPTLQHITDVFHGIGMFLQLQDMFHFVFDVEWASNTTHQLVGVVTYYGKHYSTFFFHTKLKIWIYFDDAAVREIGPSWEQVVEKCQRGRFQPLLLLFANPDSTIENDHPVHFANHTNDFTKPTPFINQRQSVINQYLMFQNSYQNMNSKLDYGHMRNMHLHNSTQESYLNNGYRTSDQRLPIYQNTSHWNVTPSYNEGLSSQVANSGQLPVYSNLQYLNSIQHKADISKLNEVSLPAVKPLPTLKPYDTISANEILMDKKDFDAAKDSDSAFTEEDVETNDMYISRKTVESVLNQQKRQMSLCRSYSQSSVGNRNSSSSLESFDNLQPTKLGPIKSILPENMVSRRDSGSWSSDRNSCSSNNSIENPFLTVMASKRLLLGLNKKNQLPDFSSTNTSDHGYDSYSVSSSDSYPSVNGSPVKLDPRLTQIPEDWLPEEDNDLDKKLKLVTEDTSGPPDCDKLCAEADLLLAKSHEKEKDGDLVMAALLCDSAAARARAAMEAPYNNSRSLVSAKMKHSTCVLRSANLYRRLKDHETDERRKQKGHTGHHSRQSSRDSTHSKHSRQSSKDSTHSKTSSKENKENSDEAENFGKNIEIYGTLPKKGSRKKNTNTSGSLKVKDDQVYKDFLDKQRKNTSLAESLNETMMKNVDISHIQGESNSKTKSPTQTKSSEKAHRKSYTEGMPPKSPTRKKVDTPPKNTDSDVKKRTLKQQHVEPTYPNFYSGNKSNSVEINNKDLLSPISTPDKKQHKIKRKLMGGFMKRKNRSLPDLREDQGGISDRMDCFLDDAIIQVPSTLLLPNGKAKKQADSGIGGVTRGFHQPHHAFVKKDLTQRPLLMKVNPPNVQPSILTSPKTKLIHTLPSIPKTLQESNAKLDPCPSTILKPSKIPFISTLPKCEPANLPPLSPPRSLETKLTSKSNILNKTSAIPVLTPQVPLSPLKANNLMRDNPIPEIKQQCQDPPVDKEDLPLPSNPFLAEIQAKRKQVLEKTSKREGNSDFNKPTPSYSQMNESKELSMLPKLARSAEGTSWLKELQSKQQQLLNKQESPKVFPKPPNRYDAETTRTSNNAVEKIADTKTTDNVDGCSWKPAAENSLESSRQNNSTKSEISTSKTSSSVRDIASRFEKVLKMPQDKHQPLSPVHNIEQRTNCNKNTELHETKEPIGKSLTQRTELDSVLNVPANSTSTNSNLPLKPALKAWTDFNQSNEIVDTKFQSNVESPNSLQDRTIVKPILKQQDVLTNSLDVCTAESSVANAASQRPMQPPDYVTAMQRLEFIRTSTSDTNFVSPETVQVKPDAPKKRQGPKKTVTFSDEVVLVACAEYDEIDFSSNPLFERVYQQHVESGKGEIPILSGSYNAFGRNAPDSSMNECSLPPPGDACNLCHTKQVTPPNTYCTDCEFYLSRFKA